MKFSRQKIFKFASLRSRIVVLLLLCYLLFNPELCYVILAVATGHSDFHIIGQFFLIHGLVMHVYL